MNDVVEPPLVDEATLSELRMLGDDILADVIGVYLEDIPGKLDALEAALDAGDLDAATTLAHTVKGASATVGASRAARLLASIEHAGRAGDRDALHAQRQDLRPIVEQSLIALRALIA